MSQVIDVGSGKGYLCSFLSMQYNLQVFGIDCSSTNTRGAQERNRKIKRFSRAYQKHGQVVSNQDIPNEELRGMKENDNEQEERMQSQPRPRLSQERQEDDGEKEREMKKHEAIDKNHHIAEEVQCFPLPDLDGDAFSALSGSRESEPTNADLENIFYTVLAADIVEQASTRVPPSQLSTEERERRKRENLERKARNAKGNTGTKNLYSPLTSYVTAETELRTLITELEVRGEQYGTTLGEGNYSY